MPAEIGRPNTKRKEHTPGGVLLNSVCCAEESRKKSVNGGSLVDRIIRTVQAHYKESDVRDGPTGAQNFVWYSLFALVWTVCLSFASFICDFSHSLQNRPGQTFADKELLLIFTESCGPPHILIFVCIRENPGNIQ
jgi:hypothetical protein